MSLGEDLKVIAEQADEEARKKIKADRNRRYGRLGAYLRGISMNRETSVELDQLSCVDNELTMFKYIDDDYDYMKNRLEKDDIHVTSRETDGLGLEYKLDWSQVKEGK